MARFAGLWDGAFSQGGGGGGWESHWPQVSHPSPTSASILSGISSWVQDVHLPPSSPKSPRPSLLVNQGRGGLAVMGKLAPSWLGVGELQGLAGLLTDTTSVHLAWPWTGGGRVLGEASLQGPAWGWGG